MLEFQGSVDVVALQALPRLVGTLSRIGCWRQLDIGRKEDAALESLDIATQVTPRSASMRVFSLR